MAIMNFEFVTRCAVFYITMWSYKVNLSKSKNLKEKINVVKAEKKSNAKLKRNKSAKKISSNHCAKITSGITELVSPAYKRKIYNPSERPTLRNERFVVLETIELETYTTSPSVFTISK